ncbi:MAG TPA: STELLO glycosyltransferase family protein [Sedimentisphaerales bacterium]|nr:STELLO glycosyltransferase family protein [Sedimentisphaerales bacterium]
MLTGKFIIITTINYPAQAVKTIAKTKRDWTILAVADRRTPPDWSCQNVRLLSIDEQKAFDSDFVQECPLDHYARKNVGYLKSIRDGAQVIAETDDDNIPKENFLTSVNQSVKGRLVEKSGWENVYTHFTGERIWPRGFPLEYINQSFEASSSLNGESVFDCPIQQYLVDGNPDVDAIYRLTTKVDMKFRSNTVVLSEGTFCPFNSQNTIWWPDAFALLYLPSSVSFRVTDIWRSFIAQICLHKAGKKVAFGPATMFQDRNKHSLVGDFADEISGYLNNARIMELLSNIRLSNEPNQIGTNMRLCYERLVEAKIVPQNELRLVDLWLKDIGRFAKHCDGKVETKLL